MSRNVSIIIITVYTSEAIDPYTGILPARYMFFNYTQKSTTFLNRMRIYWCTQLQSSRVCLMYHGFTPVTDHTIVRFFCVKQNNDAQQGCVLVDSKDEREIA